MTRTRSEARRRAARGHRDPDAQADIATVAPDPPQSDPRVTQDPDVQAGIAIDNPVVYVCFYVQYISATGVCYM